jgi:hypothetical protein
MIWYESWCFVRLCRYLFSCYICFFLNLVEGDMAPYRTIVYVKSIIYVLCYVSRVATCYGRFWVKKYLW